MTAPLLSRPTPSADKLELLRQHFPGAIEQDTNGQVRINAAALQLAIDPAASGGVRIEEDGYELRWVGKREAYHSAFVPVQKILQPLPGDSQDWEGTGNVLIRGDNLDALRLLERSDVARAGFGDGFVDSYIKLKMAEWNSFMSHASAWERLHNLDC